MPRPAEQFAAAADYDAILLDVMLPGDVDGFTLCRRMRESGIDTPVLMLTARDGVADRVHGLDIGAGRLPHQAVLVRRTAGETARPHPTRPFADP